MVCCTKAQSKVSWMVYGETMAQPKCGTNSLECQLSGLWFLLAKTLLSNCISHSHEDKDIKNIFNFVSVFPET